MSTDDAQGSNDSVESSIPSIDTFSQVNAALIDHGCLKKPLDVSELSNLAKKALSDLLYSMLAQRQEDANFREQLASKLRVTDSSLERTKRFWKEEQEKTADLSRRLETSKARIGTTTQELNECQSNLKRTKEELQKSKRDLLNVKQQVHQQKQASERQLERLRSKFSDESIKSLRAKVPEVYIANAKEASSSSLRRSGSSPPSLERKQIEELESKRRELIEANAALKRLATESLNLAREAGQYLNRADNERREEAERAVSLGSSTNSSSSDRTIIQGASSLLYQRDLFPSLFPLRSDYSIVPTRGQKQHPAVEALNRMSESIHVQGVKLLESVSSRPLIESEDRSSLAKVVVEKTTQDKRAQDEESKRDAEQERLLSRALQRVQDLEVEVKRGEREMASMQSRKEDREERIKQTAEVEKQRQRYLTLCRELEKQEELLRLEKEAVQREREEVMKTELSLSMQEEQNDSSTSLPSFDVSNMTNSSHKRGRDDEKENNEQSLLKNGKRIRVEQQKTSTPKGDTMRFVTMRKQRAARLQ